MVLLGVTSGARFGVLGRMRAAAQGVSYEVALALLLLSGVSMSSSLCIVAGGLSKSLLAAPLWMVCVVAETNRAPLDFGERESELISGFNLEFGGRGFVLVFLGEYRALLGLALVTSSWLTGGVGARVLFFFGVLLLRRAFPRFRHDLLMGLC